MNVGTLTRYPTTAPHWEQQRLVCEVLPHAIRCGLRLRAMPTIQFVDAPLDVARGCCERRRDGSVYIWLRADLGGRELARVLLHELQHAADQQAGAWRVFSESEREARAESFAASAVERFSSVEW